MVDYLKGNNVIEPLPLFLKDNSNLNIIYDKKTCNVSVKYCLYDKKKKRILKISENRPLCQRLSKLSIHAEELAIRDIIRLDPKNKCDIYIWRYGKTGDIKTSTCCKSCTKLANKYNFQNRIFTFKDNEIINAVIDNPSVSLGNMLRNL